MRPQVSEDFVQVGRCPAEPDRRTVARGGASAGRGARVVRPVLPVNGNGGQFICVQAWVYIHDCNVLELVGFESGGWVVENCYEGELRKLGRNSGGMRDTEGEEIEQGQDRRAGRGPTRRQLRHPSLTLLCAESVVRPIDLVHNSYLRGTRTQRHTNSDRLIDFNTRRLQVSAEE